ncbi:MAG: response regulator [Nitrospirae bacterium]|nr:response regulator [Nitrospirota bacterium]
MAESKILIVEDEVLPALELQFILKGLGYAVQTSTNGEEAVLLAGEENPDIVLMDISIDGEMDGIQTADNIGLGLGIPIIFMTGYSDEEVIEKAKHINPVAILSKPLDMHILKSVIKSAIEKTT